MTGQWKEQGYLAIPAPGDSGAVQARGGEGDEAGPERGKMHQGWAHEDDMGSTTESRTRLVGVGKGRKQLWTSPATRTKEGG